MDPRQILNMSDLEWWLYYQHNKGERDFAEENADIIEWLENDIFLG